MATENQPGGLIEISLMPRAESYPASWENPTVALRFVTRAIPINPSDPSICRFVNILQQRWDIYENGLPAATRFEWRDVPLVTE